MGLFDAFSKKEDPQKQLDVLKKDLHQFTEKLEMLSSSMHEQAESIKNIPMNDLPKKVITVTEALNVQDDKIKATISSIESLKEVKTGSEELAQHARNAIMNLGALNMVVELELKDASSYLKVFNKYCSEMAQPFTDLEQLLDQIPGFNQELIGLAARIEGLKAKLDKE